MPLSVYRRRNQHARAYGFEDHRHPDDHRSRLFHSGRHFCGRGALAAGVGAASGLTGAYWAALFLTLVGGICQLVAGIQGVRYSQSPESSKTLIMWGVVVALFNILGVAMNVVNSGEFAVETLLTGVAVPILYIYGAARNVKPGGKQYKS